MKDRARTARRTPMRAALPLSFWLLLLLALAGCGGGGDGADDDIGGDLHGTPTPVVTQVATPEPTATPVVVAPGALDPSFGTEGIVFVPTAGGTDFVRHSLRVLADGGVELLVLDRTATATTVRIVHLLPDGTRIDDELVSVAPFAARAAFGSNGDVWIMGCCDPQPRLSRFSRHAGVATEEHSSPLALSAGADLVPLADGGMLAVGSRNVTAAALQRFAASGIADPTFGGGPPLPDGLALGPVRAGDVSITFAAAAIADDGRILVAGTYYERIAFIPSVTVFDATGRLAVFGQRGSVTLGGIGSGYLIAAAPDGGAVVGLGMGGLARIDSRGVRDPTYAAPVEPPDLFYALTMDGSGALTGVGATTAGESAPFVTRLRADGTGDPRFGGTGRVVTRFDSAGVQSADYYAFELLPAGRITVAGTVCRASLCDLVVARYGDVAD